MNLIQKWYQKYRKEPYWIDNWNNQLDRPNRLIVRDKNGNSVAREARLKCTKTQSTWQLSDYCKYCTNFLIEQSEPIVNWKERLHITTDPCSLCGIRETLKKLREEESITDFSAKREKSIQEVNEYGN